MKSVQAWIGETLRNVVRDSINEKRKRCGLSGKDPLSPSDLGSTEEAFLMLFKSGGVPIRHYREIEEWVVSYLETEFEKRDRSSAEKFILDLTKKVVSILANILTKYDLTLATRGQRMGECLTEQDSVADPLVKAKLVQKGFHETDAEHLAGAIGFGRRGNTDPLFVSSDYKDIVNRREEILQLGGPFCCDPLYTALHALHLFS
jgi:hypothetical protein